MRRYSVTGHLGWHDLGAQEALRDIGVTPATMRMPMFSPLTIWMTHLREDDAR